MHLILYFTFLNHIDHWDDPRLFQVKRVRSASATLGHLDSSKDALVVLDESKNQHYSSQRQMQLQEEEHDLQALAERERAIRQLEVTESSSEDDHQVV